LPARSQKCIGLIGHHAQPLDDEVDIARIDQDDWVGSDVRISLRSG
jgi:hypothetical protein